MYTREDNTKNPAKWTSTNTIALVVSLVSIVLIIIIILVKCGCFEKWKKDYNEKMKARMEDKKENGEESKSLTGGESENEEESGDEDLAV